MTTEKNLGSNFDEIFGTLFDKAKHHSVPEKPKQGASIDELIRNMEHNIKAIRPRQKCN